MNSTQNKTAFRLSFSGRLIVGRIGETEIASWLSTRGHSRHEVHPSQLPIEQRETKCDVAGCEQVGAYFSGNEAICEHHYTSLPMLDLDSTDWPKPSTDERGNLA